MQLIVKAYVVEDSMLPRITTISNNLADLEVIQKTWSPCSYRPCTFWDLVIKDPTD
jgi:hypothetical protein